MIDVFTKIALGDFRFPLGDHLVLGAVDSSDGKGYVSMRENGIVRFK